MNSSLSKKLKIQNKSLKRKVFPDVCLQKPFLASPHPCTVVAHEQTWDCSCPGIQIDPPTTKCFPGSTHSDFPWCTECDAEKQCHHCDLCMQRMETWIKKTVSWLLIKKEMEVGTQWTLLGHNVKKKSASQFLYFLLNQHLKETITFRGKLFWKLITQSRRHPSSYFFLNLNIDYGRHNCWVWCISPSITRHSFGMQPGNMSCIQRMRDHCGINLNSPS